jgi:signal transduction histidine kinase/streptogramin lyase
LDKSDPSSISDNSIWSVYKDHQSRIWVGTFSKGICVYDKIKNKFGELDISLPNDVVNAIWKDQKNRLWIGTEGGLVMQQGDHVKYYTHQRDNKSTLPNDPVLTIFEDSKNRLWFGTWDGGVSRYDEQHDNFINYTHDPANAFSLSDPNVYSIKEERATHRMLVSSYFGLNILEDERLHKFGKRFDSVTWNNFLRVVFEDSHGIVWLGSYAGFTRYDLKQNTRTRYLFDALAGSGATINCINEDKEGTIWVGSNKGLHQVQNNILVKTFTTFHGLPNDNVNGILFDDHGNLWLGTYKGISKFDMQANSFTNYDINDGLVSNEFKRNSCFKSNDGQLYFGGKGVSVFYPDSIKTNPHTPSVFLTGLKIIDKTINFGAEDSVLRYPIAETREITLKPEFNFFTIEYVALNFTASNKNQFAYKLEGFDNDWVNAGSQRFATFTNLDPATYIFRVKASNNDGLWNEKGTSIIIHVLPYWWETWWFKIILVISLVSGVILVFILRTRRMRRISVELELAVNQKTKELQQTNQALRKREAEIEEQNRMLTLQGEKMIAKNIELVSSQQELSVKSDLLLQQNEQLTKAQKTIEQHNMSIAQQNENLEKEVAKRTEELVQYNQQLEQFAFISAHNLRAPVARVLGLGQLLELAQANPEEKELIYPKLIFATKELDGVVKDFNSILAIKRSDDTYITKVNLNDEILMIQSNLKAEIANTQTKIISDFSQVCSISTVKSSLDSILFHLVSNAIKFRHPDRTPVIYIKTEMAGNEICLSVSDNGLGINLSRYRDKLFTLYGRFHFHIQGKGMGLYIVKTQLATLGGRIEVDSEEEAGSTFRTYFKSQN